MGPWRSARSAPGTLRASSQPGASCYELAEDLVAIHRTGASGGARAPAQGGGASVVPAASQAAQSAEDASVGPVYRRVPGGGLAMPTGRVLVRFSEGVAADRRRHELARAGYVAEEVLRHAPHAVWVRASSREITEALRDLSRLEALAQVENVEPQLISERALRG